MHCPPPSLSTGYWLLTAGFSHFPVAFTNPIQFQYLPGWFAAVLFVGLGAIIVMLGLRSLAGLGPVRKWVAMSIRLLVLLVLLLIIGGLRLTRPHEDLEVILLGDVSASVENVTDYPGAAEKNGLTVQQALENYYRALSKDPHKHQHDRIGLISFGAYPKVDALPNDELRLDTRGVPQPEMRQGTNVAAAVQLALATMSPDAMHRLVLVSDGNANAGDTEAAANAAKSQNVPIDIAPLRYDVQNEVLIDRFEAPAWKRENEPFTLRVVLKSTNRTPVTGKLRVKHQTQDGDEDLDMDLSTKELEAERVVTLNPASSPDKPGLTVELVKVPALKNAGVHRFHAVFTPDKADTTGVTTGLAGTTAPSQKSDAIEENNIADNFTFVQGKGQVLYVDNTGLLGPDSPGALLAKAMADEKITLKTINIDQFPANLVELQSYDAVVLANVPKGDVIIDSGNGAHSAGLSNQQDAMLRTYVHDMGGGLVMIGGESAFGAGGWEGSEVEKILPVDMAIPAQRQIGKGALCLIMHSCEMPNGNFWGLMCAQQAVKVLSARDEVGVISYGWNGGVNNPGIGGAQWDYPLSEKGDGSRVGEAMHKMQLGDMPDFDDALNLALNGAGTTKGLKDSNARHKHVIIISDGDPSAPKKPLVAAYKANKISVSTVTVYPHQRGQNNRPPVMNDIPAALGGKAYGPIEDNFNQLPQIFIKEATIVKRSLIHEEEKGIPIKVSDSSDDMVRGLAEVPPVLGMVLTSRKNDPKVEMPFAAGPMNDPILAHWQAGLGKSAVWTSDATRKWAPAWVRSAAYPKLWAQIIRGVSRPPMSSDFEPRTTITGNKGEIVVEALNKEGDYANFLSMTATVAGGRDLSKPQSLRFVQTGPGTYKATFDAPTEGAYVAVVNYRGKNGGGMLLTGAVMNTSAERRELRSDEAKLEQIRATTGGRILDAFEPHGADIFSRDGLVPTSSPLPVWDYLIPFLLGLIILDVAVRRIAWDWNSTRRLATAAVERVRGFTVVRKVESRETLDALQRVRKEVAETKLKPQDAAGAGSTPPPTPGAAAAAARPDPKAKFQAKGVEGDITQIVGGATDKPIPAAPKKIEPKGAQPGTGGHMGGLMAAKKRAQQQIKEKEQGEG